MKEEKPRGGGVIISPRPHKTRVVIDQYGNEIDLKTKQIIKKKQDESILR